MSAPNELRDLENKPGAVYDANKTKILFAEDWSLLKDWIDYLLGLFSGKQDILNSGINVNLTTNPQLITKSTFPYEIVKFDTERWDTLGEYSSSTGKFTATKAGKYQVNASLYYQSMSSGKFVTVAIQVNGSRQANVENFSGDGGDSQVIVSDILNLSVGDEVTIGARHNDSVDRYVLNQNISTYLSIQKIS